MTFFHEKLQEPSNWITSISIRPELMCYQIFIIVELVYSKLMFHRSTTIVINNYYCSWNEWYQLTELFQFSFIRRHILIFRQNAITDGHRNSCIPNELINYHNLIAWHECVPFRRNVQSYQVIGNSNNQITSLPPLIQRMG